MDDSDRQGQAHRAGLFKTAPKKHSIGRHRSKRAIARLQKGKISANSLNVQKRHALSKTERRQRLSQIRANKSAKLTEKRRLEGDAPFLVTVVSLDNSRPAQQIVQFFSKADAESKAIESGQSAVCHLNVPRFRARFSFLCPSTFQSVLDSVRASDLLLLIWPLGVECLLSAQERLLAALLAQGLPTTINAISGMPKSGKQRETARKQLDKVMRDWHTEHKSNVYDLDTAGDALKILRQMSTGKKSTTNLQGQRPYLVVENVQLDEEHETNSPNCTLKVSGFLRGAPLSVNKLVHLPGWGDFQLARIDRILEPCPMKTANDKRTPLDSEIVPDPMEAEQTWPSEKEIEENKFVVPKVSRKVPKGTSEYQANWLIDDSDGTDENDEDESEEAEEEEKEDEEMGESEDGKADDQQSILSAGEESEMDAGNDGDDGTDEAARERFRQQRENLQWPDEVETPRDISARERFQRYRGLKSFRTSPWDPKENLPHDYARIYKFVDFKRTRKLAFAEAQEAFKTNTTDEFAHPGTYVTLHIANMPRRILDFVGPSSPPLVVYGLLRHEHRMTVLNIVLQKHQFGSNSVIKSKDRLIFQVGCRRFAASPLFSQNTNGQKFKLERFMPSQGAFCATLFAPVTYPPTNVTVFLAHNSQPAELVAYGILLNANPDRIVLKRTVLSGHPYKVNKRTAVVRYMFYNREDIEWFKPVELYTHEGRRGRIKQPLGTHGLVKCVFDQPLSVQDSVLMNLYKRVFPKWDYDDRLEGTNATNSDGRNSNFEEEEEKRGERGGKTVTFLEKMIIE
ncbi:hypothetical protein niasHS_003731 [Heterodera schachtii]|uniref:Pre-rRNA-processing protein TSR1 homolog n=1 Tax=Heterodera schachtii TaxID=97005 RepID=A0ABD2KHC6_HETSC